MSMAAGRLAALALALALGAGALVHTDPAVARNRRRSPAYSPAQAGTAFGLALMRRLPEGNLVFSPDSIQTALAMAGTGAEGQTARQMATAIRLRSPDEFKRVGTLQRQIAAAESAAAAGSAAAPVLNVADTLFLQQDLAVRTTFLSGLQTAFGASLQSVDFAHDLPAAEAAINGWADEQTHGLIPRVVSDLPPGTLLALANAIYMKAHWSTRFKPGATEPDAFRLASGETVQTPFMHQTEDFRYGAGRGYALVELPYAASDLEMDVVLPTGQSAGRLLASLSASSLDAMLAAARSRPVKLSLPRFQFSFAEALNGPLEALGMRAAFHEGADFTGVSTSPPLEVGLVEHAADIAVDEEGTEAAAVTIVSIEATSLREFAPAPVPFDADRPFLFFIRDRHTGALLFAGRVTDPDSS